MDYIDTMTRFSRPTPSKIVMLVMDGLGGLPVKELGGRTELEAARKPNIDKLARSSALGLHRPIAPGITPGSGPAHFALFGYDPVKWEMGRGVLETLGVGFDLKQGDVAVRTNFCTLDEKGLITDRRAGRIPTSECARLSEMLDKKVKLAGVKTFFMPVRDYRGGIVLRAKGLGANVGDTDPQVVGAKPLAAIGANAPSRKSAKLLNDIVKQTRRIIKNERPANGILLRGISSYRPYPSFKDVYKLRAACIAVYPMYRGASKIAGMDLIGQPQTLDEELKLLKETWEDYDFFFFHFKYTDSKGEDGDVKGKVREIEKFDKAIPKVLKLKPDVLILTGDHSTPTQLKSHSWHPVPLLISGPALRADSSGKFGETECSAGSLDIINATNIMPLAMAQAGKLLKFGA